MLAKKQLNELAERRRLLVAEADLHRSLIVMEVENIRVKTAWLGQARQYVSAGKPLLAAGGVVAGLLAVRHWRKVAAWMPSALAAFRWLRNLSGR